MRDDKDFGVGIGGDLARRVHVRLDALGVSVTPRAARILVDTAAGRRAEAADTTVRTVLRRLARGSWAEDHAKELVLQLEAPTLEEQVAIGTVDLSQEEAGRLVMAVTVSLQLQSTSAYLEDTLTNPWPARLGHRTDVVCQLAAALRGGGPAVAVERRTLVAAARHLEVQAADLRGGTRLAEDVEPFREETAARYDQDAGFARRLSERS